MSKILKNNDFCKNDVFPKFTLGTMSKSLKNCVFFAKTAFFPKFTLGTMCTMSKSLKNSDFCKKVDFFQICCGALWALWALWALCQKA